MPQSSFIPDSEPTKKSSFVPDEPGILNVQGTPQEKFSAAMKYLTSPQNLANIGGGVIGGAAAGPIGASVGAAIGNQLFDPELANKSTTQNILETGFNIGANELTGRLVGVIPRLAKMAGLIKSGGVEAATGVSPELLKLEPTYSQMTGGRLSRGVERYFGGHAHLNSLIESGQITTDEANKIIGSLAPGTTLDTLKAQAGQIQKGYGQQFQNVLAESTARGNMVKGITQAPQNASSYTEYQVVPQKMPNGQTINTLQALPPKNVAGKIDPKNFVDAVNALKSELESTTTKPDPNSPIWRNINNYINDYTMLDSQGRRVLRPQDFARAWEEKKAIQDMAYPMIKNEPVYLQKKFANLGAALDRDITDSLPNLPLKGNLASTLYNEAKEIVGKRETLFGKTDSPVMSKMLRDTKEPIASVDSLMLNPKMMQKALDASEIPIPDQGGFKYLTTNSRKDLQSYETGQIFNQAREVDSMGNVTYDGEKLMSRFLDPKRRESYNKLFGSPLNPNSYQSRLKEFITNAATVGGSPIENQSPYWNLRLTAAGLTLGTGLISGIAEGQLPLSRVAGAGLIGGTIAFNGISKLLNNPESAKFILAAQKGTALGAPSKIASRIIGNVLKGTTMTLMYSDGTENEGKINQEGKFELTR